jgi:hypothetical protein
MYRFIGCKLSPPLLGACAAVLVLAGTSGATHLGSLQLGHVNTSTAQTTLTGNLASPMLKVVNQGGAAALRGDAQTGIGVNGVSVSGTGQQGESQSGIGLVGAHKSTAGANPGVQGTTPSTDPLAAGVVGKNTGGGPGLRAIVNAGAPPLAVNSSAKVINLNADSVDGKDAADFLPINGTAANADKLDGHDSGDFYLAGTPVGDADTLDGHDSSYFLPAAGVAADADKLDGHDSIEFYLHGQPINAGTLDDLDSTDFLRSSAKAADADMLDGTDSSGFWKAGGNAGTSPGTDFLGTSDDKALELKVNGQRVLRLEPATDQTINNTGFDPNVIGGFSGNSVTSGQNGATIAGGGASGYPNAVTGPWGAIGGGIGNTAGDYATVAGGTTNLASGEESTVAGGGGNQATGFASTAAGGEVNKATAASATVSGGYNNTASNLTSTVVGGYGNTASGDSSTVLGRSNTASGTVSMAAGYRAKADDDGAFIWGDSQQVTTSSSPGVNTFSVRAGGGLWLGTTDTPSITSGHFIDTSTGAYLTSTGTWTNSSDRAKKHGFHRVDRTSILGKVARMPITSWSYKGERAGVRHIGPTAQDFYLAFGLGLDDKHITTIDEGGVALAAIQALYRQNVALQARVTSLEHRLSAQGRER